MLQQTRVDQAQPYYDRFVAAFPTVRALAEADLDVVLRQWEGLGYYARARNLHRAAQIVSGQYEGRLPSTYEALRALPGIGPYTARAILSIAFGLPHAALDANVRRVLSRLCALARGTETELQRLASSLLDRERPGDFNQALMELGALVCAPKAPQCARCPLSLVCGAFAEGVPEAYPERRKRPNVPHHDVATGVLFDRQGRLLIQRRSEESMLGGLWELPGGKREGDESIEDACRRELREELGIDVEVGELVDKVNHAYTHFKITMYAFRCCIREGAPKSAGGLPLRWVLLSDLDGYAFPRANRRILDALVRNSRGAA